MYLVEYLLQFGADIDAKDNLGNNVYNFIDNEKDKLILEE